MAVPLFAAAAFLVLTSALSVVTFYATFDFPVPGPGGGDAYPSPTARAIGAIAALVAAASSAAALVSLAWAFLRFLRNPDPLTSGEAVGLGLLLLAISPLLFIGTLGTWVVLEPRTGPTAIAPQQVLLIAAIVAVTATLAASLLLLHSLHLHLRSRR